VTIASVLPDVRSVSGVVKSMVVTSNCDCNLVVAIAKLSICSVVNSESNILTSSICPVKKNPPDGRWFPIVSANVRDGVFHHVAFTYDGSESASGVKIYIDGTLSPTNTIKDNLTGSTLNNVSLTIGNQNPTAGFFFTGQMDDVRIFDFELTTEQIDNLAIATTKLQSQLEVTAMDLTTPNTPLTSGKTEAIVTLSFDVTHIYSPATLTGDENGLVRLDSINFEINQADSTISTVSDPLDPSNNILSVRVPLVTTTAKTSALIGTIKVPLVSDIRIDSVSIRNDPIASSTLLIAKAQAYRYVLAVHSIGGSSGQAEVRGNDAIMALGLGFQENNSDHAGTEGSLEEIEATYMHELGHLLNLQHGGPRYLQSAPETTLERTLQNCVPIQKSIMSYTGQLPAYLSGDWALRFNEESGVTLDENTMAEFDGVTRSDGGLIVFATPFGVTAYRNDFLANGDPIDWNGDLDSGTGDDESPFIDGDSGAEDLAHWDVNNFGISGCEETPGEIFEIFDEPANFDFQFRDGPYGQFDGGFGEPSPTGVPDENADTLGEKKLAGSVFDLIAPIQEDGTVKKPIKIQKINSLALKLELFERGITDTDRGPEIIDATIRVVQISDFNDDGIPEIENIGSFEFEPQLETTSTDHYHFQWLLLESFKGETIGIRYVLEVDVSGVTIDFPLTLSTDINPTPLNVLGEGVTMLVEFAEEKEKGPKGPK